LNLQRQTQAHIVADLRATAERQAKLGAKASLMSDSASAVLAAG
jgi:hypothetical protein